jgi:signal transduction histidine kinase
MKEIALHIMDIMQNSVAADSSEISVSVRLLDNDKWIQIIIADNGCGMDEDTLKAVVDPFHTSRTTRKISYTKIII